MDLKLSEMTRASSHAMEHQFLSSSTLIFEPSQISSDHHNRATEILSSPHYAQVTKGRPSSDESLSYSDSTWERQKLLNDYEESFDHRRALKRQLVQYCVGYGQDRTRQLENWLGSFGNIDDRHQQANTDGDAEVKQ